MADMNGQFSDDRTVDIAGDDVPKSDSKTETIAALEQENRKLVHEKDAIKFRIGDLKQSVEDAENERNKLLLELKESKDEIKTLGSVAARASELEGEVSRLQHDLISTTSELDEVTRELSGVKSALDGSEKKENDKSKEYEAVLAERDLLIEKLGKLEAKENGYLKEMNEKEMEIGNLRAKVEELKVAAGKSGDDKKGMDNLKRELEMRVRELERKLEDKERVINGFEEKETGRLMTGDFYIGWPLIAGSAVCAVGLTGVVFYLHQEKRN
ncbi:hypothetical protein LIER_11288 [Lithospermum erythrorhizon]|uniref:Uncharacterized protein n=1 Tax=Lithospermum erythrorhizon TaxID=34254 RepID=A0AAV3PRI2_LITER